MTSPIFDPDSPYASLKAHEINGYLRATVSGHPVADNRHRARLHRAVLFDAIGPGPHACHWCGIGGLDWKAGQSEVDYLVVDHLNGNRQDNRLANLVPTHKSCNDNRAIVERLHIPWERLAVIPLADRPPLRTRVGQPTEAALQLAAGPATSPEATAATVASDEGVEVPASTSTPVLALPAAEPSTAGEHRIYTWDDFVDRAELVKGNVALKGPPRWLLDKYPALRKVDFSRFGR